MNISISIEGVQQSADTLSSIEVELIIDKWLAQAQNDSLEHLQEAALQNTSSGFKHNTGELDSHFKTHIYSDTAGSLFNDSPYAWRREMGFSGKTDKRGRFYREDPGILYMGEALDSSRDWIEEKYTEAIQQALEEIAETAQRRKSQSALQIAGEQGQMLTEAMIRHVAASLHNSLSST